MLRLQLQLGDITSARVDAIVNSTDSTLLHGGPVHEAVHRVAGPSLKVECRAIGGCDEGAAVITSGHGLTASHVIHTVAPTWQGGGHYERETLAHCYWSSLTLAAERGIHSLAFPSIGSGLQPQIPLEEAAPIAIQTILNFLDQHEKPERVVMVLFDAPTFVIHQKILKERLPDD